VKELIAPAIKYPNIVIPAKAGIQVGTGCRIKSGMTELPYLVAGLITHVEHSLIDAVSLAVIRRSAMKITRDEVRHVTRLARLKLSEEQEGQLTAQLNNVLEYMERLNELNTEGVEPTFHTSSLQNAFREDEVRPSLPKEISLDNAPKKTESFFVVPKVI
jgi:aspartyl-tRNA(Asn)/glutamyl-tRNA(Gln) amidotransferase subunit C